jgi:hypothetical protein
MGYSVYTIQNDSGSFQALGPSGGIGLPDPGPETLAEVLLVDGWVYGTGAAPRITRGSVHATAQGTRVVVHTIPDTTQDERVRVILLNGSDVQVKHDALAGSVTLVDDGTYVDVWLGGANRIRYSDIEDFDRDTTPGSEGIMDEVDQARAENNVD